MSKRKEILIIGNGRSVLDHSFGEQINAIPIVGRINNFSVENVINLFVTIYYQLISMSYFPPL